MEMQEKIYDVIIIGSGPAGLSNLRGARQTFHSCWKPAISAGGQAVNTYEVDNYLETSGNQRYGPWEYLT